MSKKATVLKFLELHTDKNIINFLPNEFNIDYFNEDDLNKIASFCDEYTKIENRKKSREIENQSKKELVRKYLDFLSKLDIKKNSFYFTLKVRAIDAREKLNEYYSDLYKKNFFDDSIYNF